jgi:hypothetical protein
VGNFYTTTINGVGFTNASTMDFHLTASSPYRSRATDGRDPGANIDATLLATAGVIVP